MDIIKERRSLIMAIAIPIIIQSIIQHLMILTDRAFLGNLDSSYLSAIGNVMVPYTTLLFFFFSLSTGLTVLIAQNIGAKDIKRAQILGESSFLFSTLISTGMFLVWFLGGESILTLFGAEGTILRDAVVYVKILSISLIFLGIDVSVVAILQGVGVTRPIMIFGIVKSVLNIGLDWVMIFGKLGFPAMGLAGGAWATTISSVLGSLGILVTVLIMRGVLPFQLTWREMAKPNWMLYWASLKVGLPSGLESLLWSTGQMVMAWLLNRIDGMAIGIFSLVHGIQLLALFIYLGIAKAAMTLVGQYWGEKRPDKAIAVGMQCQRMSLMTTAFFGLLFMIFPKTLAGIFTSDPEVITRAIPLLRVAAITIQLQAVNVIMGHCIRGTGDTKWMMYSQIFGTSFVIGVSFLLIFGLSMGLMGMYLTVLLDELVRGGINYIRFASGKNPFRRFIPAWSASEEA